MPTGALFRKMRTPIELCDDLACFFSTKPPIFRSWFQEPAASQYFVIKNMPKKPDLAWLFVKIYRGENRYKYDKKRLYGVNISFVVVFVQHHHPNFYLLHIGFFQARNRLPSQLSASPEKRSWPKCPWPKKISTWLLKSWRSQRPPRRELSGSTTEML